MFGNLTKTRNSSLLISKYKVIILILIVFLFPTMLLSFMLISSGKVSTSWNNFAIDSNERLYIGKRNSIEVYEDGKLVKTINPLSSRTYAFTIQNDDTLLLSTSTVEYVLDLDGNIISSKEDNGTNTYNKIKNNREFITENGKSYKLENHLGRYSLVCDGVVVYQMPDFDYVVKLLYNLSYFAFCACVIVIIWKSKKDKTKEKNGTVL